MTCENCMTCGCEEEEDMSPEEVQEMRRELLKELVSALSDNQDLAAKLALVLKLALEQRQ